MRDQLVYISRTQSGQRGLFTNRMLAFPLSEDATLEQIQALVRRLGFKLEDRSTQS